jgi:hypothetical protein
MQPERSSAIAAEKRKIFLQAIALEWCKLLFILYFAKKWKKGYWIVFEGYVVSIYTKENAIGEITIVCNDDSFDIDTMPDGFTGIRINVSSKFYEMNLKDKITEESEVMVFGSLNKFKDYYPSVRSNGIIVMDDIKTEKIIQDVTAGFQSDFARDESNEDEPDDEKPSGKIDGTVESDDDDDDDDKPKQTAKPASKSPPSKKSKDEDDEDEDEDDKPKQPAKPVKKAPAKDKGKGKGKDKGKASDDDDDDLDDDEPKSKKVEKKQHRKKDDDDDEELE